MNRSKGDSRIAPTGFWRDLVLGLALVLGSPFWLGFILLRRHRRSHFFERLHCTAEGSFAIWFHAASVGEVLALQTLLEKWHESHPGDRLLLTTNTTSGRRLAKERFPFCHVQLAPLDWGPLLDRWARGLLLRIHVLSELDIWPSRQDWLTRNGIPTVVLGARLSPRGLRRTQCIWHFLRRAYQSVAFWGVRDEGVRQRLESLGIPAAQMAVIGSLKYDALVGARRAVPLPDWEGRLGSEVGPVVVAGSLHPGEVEGLLSLAPRCHLVLVPRHLQKLATFQQQCQEAGVPCVLWSQQHKIPEGGCLIVDEMGLLAGLYATAAVAYVGGTGIPLGGHNVLEPACYGVPIVTGPHVFQVVDEMEALEKCGGARRGEDPAALIAAWLSNETARRHAGEGARRALENLTGGSERALKILEEQFTAPSADRKRL